MSLSQVPWASCREFNASNNLIEAIPSEIGRCRSLKKFKINGNKLRRLPPELQGCRSLEVLNASENAIESIPAELSTLPCLSSLTLANNRLATIPYSMADCNTLTDIDLSNNADLEMIPNEIKTHAKMILWVCDKWRRECPLCPSRVPSSLPLCVCGLAYAVIPLAT